MSDSRPSTLFTDADLTDGGERGDAQRPLFADLDALLEKDLAAAGDPSGDEDGAGPRLTLVHGDDGDAEADAGACDVLDADEAVDAETSGDEAMILDDDAAAMAITESFCLPDHDEPAADEARIMGHESAPNEAPTSSIGRPSEDHDESAGLLELVSSHCDGHSAGIDISLACEAATAEAVGVASSEAAADTCPAHAARRASTIGAWSAVGAVGENSSVLPRRIGEGKLRPARPRWKPSDLFGGAAERRGEAFKWEVMLTTACVTAACGMVGIWLLRTVLA